MKKYLSIYLSILFLGLVAISSCQETGQEEIKTEIQEKLRDRDPVAYENKLKELTLFMGEVFKDPAARRELFDFAKIEGNANDIEYNLRKLFVEKTNPNTRQRSAIVSAFYKNAENHRTTGEEGFNEQNLIDFINQNNIGVLAPYLFKNFDSESISELTVSWWTEEMELEALADEEMDMVTPAFKLNLKDRDNFIQFRKSGANYFTNELVYANDDYAFDNPTVVFGNFDDEMIVDPGDEWMGGGGGSQGPQPIVEYPHELEVNCTNVQSTDIVRWTMENFRITGNTRGWPHPNRITMWVNSASNASTIPMINEKKIERGDTEWKTDFISNAGVLATSWEQINYNQNIVLGVKRPTNKVRETIIVYQTNSQGEAGTQTTIKLNQDMTYLCVNQSWLRCAELNGNYMVDNDNGFIGDLAIWAYDVGRKGYEVQFTLAPKIVRFD